MRVLPILVALALAVALTSALAPVGNPASASASAAPITLAPAELQDYSQQDDDGPDVLLLSLLTIGVAAGAAVLSLIGYVIRNRVGFWLHRPPERKDGDGGSHH